MYRDYNSNDLTTIVKDLTLDFESPCTQTITNTHRTCLWCSRVTSVQMNENEVYQKFYNLMLIMYLSAKTACKQKLSANHRHLELDRSLTQLAGLCLPC